MSDSDFVAHFTKDKGDVKAFDNLVKILKSGRVNASSIPWVNKPAVCFTECPWSSLLKHVRKYSKYGVGFTKSHVFKAGGGPAYYVRSDHWKKQFWEDHIKTFVTPFWPKYRPRNHKYRNDRDLSGQTIDFTHEREWRVPHDFDFKLNEIKFVVLPDYIEMARFPKDLKDGIGREKFILFDVCQQIEKLWPTHIAR